MPDFEYKNPTELKDEEFKEFQKDPVQWMQKQIRIAVAHDPIVHVVYEGIAKQHPEWILDHRELWIERKEFYIVLAFHALLSHSNLQKEILRNKMQSSSIDFPQV